jgi:hypothetical protein
MRNSNAMKIGVIFTGILCLGIVIGGIVALLKTSTAKVAQKTQTIADRNNSDAKAAADAKTIADVKAVEATKADIEKNKELAYLKYHNDRYGYSITYPNNLYKIDNPKDGGGNTLQSNDGKVRLKIYGINNSSNKTIESVYNQALKNKKLYYKAHAGNWCVTSWVDGDKIIYEQTAVGKGSQNTFHFEFPSEQKDKYTKVVEMLNRSFKTPSLNVGH